MSTNDPYIVYILECGDGTLYTGITNDLEKRLRTHNAGKGGKYTRSRLPVQVVYTESCTGKPEALRRELAIKAMSRSDKLSMIKNKKQT